MFNVGMDGYAATLSIRGVGNVTCCLSPVGSMSTSESVRHSTVTGSNDSLCIGGYGFYFSSTQVLYVKGHNTKLKSCYLEITLN